MSDDPGRWAGSLRRFWAEPARGMADLLVEYLAAARGRPTRLARECRLSVLASPRPAASLVQAAPAEPPDANASSIGPEDNRTVQNASGDLEATRTGSSGGLGGEELEAAADTGATGDPQATVTSEGRNDSSRLDEMLNGTIDPRVESSSWGGSNTSAHLNLSRTDSESAWTSSREESRTPPDRSSPDSDKLSGTPGSLDNLPPTWADESGSDSVRGVRARWSDHGRSIRARTSEEANTVGIHRYNLKTHTQSSGAGQGSLGASYPDHRQSRRDETDEIGRDRSSSSKAVETHWQNGWISARSVEHPRPEADHWTSGNLDRDSASTRAYQSGPEYAKGSRKRWSSSDYPDRAGAGSFSADLGQTWPGSSGPTRTTTTGTGKSGAVEPGRTRPDQIMSKGDWGSQTGWRNARDTASSWTDGGSPELEHPSRMARGRSNDAAETRTDWRRPHKAEGDAARERYAGRDHDGRGATLPATGRRKSPYNEQWPRTNRQYATRAVRSNFGGFEGLGSQKAWSRSGGPGKAGADRSGSESEAVAAWSDWNGPGSEKRTGAGVRGAGLMQGGLTSSRADWTSRQQGMRGRVGQSSAAPLEEESLDTPGKPLPDGRGPDGIWRDWPGGESETMKRLHTGYGRSDSAGWTRSEKMRRESARADGSSSGKVQGERADRRSPEPPSATRTGSDSSGHSGAARTGWRSSESENRRMSPSPSRSRGGLETVGPERGSPGQLRPLDPTDSTDSEIGERRHPSR